MGKYNIKKQLIVVFIVAIVLRIGFILTLDNSIDVWGDWWDELGDHRDFLFFLQEFIKFLVIVFSQVKSVLLLLVL